VRSSESSSFMKALTSPVMRGGLPGAVPSASPPKPRSSQRSRSRRTLASLRPVVGGDAPHVLPAA
jgi:hypothetical protein